MRKYESFKSSRSFRFVTLYWDDLKRIESTFLAFTKESLIIRDTKRKDEFINIDEMQKLKDKKIKKLKYLYIESKELELIFDLVDGKLNVEYNPDNPQSQIVFNLLKGDLINRISLTYNLLKFLSVLGVLTFITFLIMADFKSNIEVLNESERLNNRLSIILLFIIISIMVFPILLIFNNSNNFCKILLFEKDSEERFWIKYKVDLIISIISLILGYLLGKL